MAVQRMRIPVDGRAHTVTFSGFFPPRRPNGDVPGIGAGMGVVNLVVEPDGTEPVEHTFQVVQTSESAPSNAKFIETVLAPLEELRWWHLFELVED